MDLLPIGSVVLLNGSDTRMMIIGRSQKDVESGRIFDYAGCLYPTGIINSNEVYLFNADDIDILFFIGFQDFEELAYRDELRKILNDTEKAEQQD